MLKKRVLLLLVFILSFINTQHVIAAPVQLTLMIKDQAGTPLSDHLSIIDFKGENYSEKFESYLGESAQASFPVEPGDYILEISARSVNEQSLFYHIKTPIEIISSDKMELRALPVAQVIGLVIDEYDNLVIDAELTFQCNPQSDTGYPRFTDKVGSFRLNNHPLGRCRVFARSKNSAGFMDIELSSNTIHSVNIKMDKKTSKRTDFSPIFLTIFLPVFTVMLYLFYFKKKTQKKAFIEKNREMKPLKEGLNINLTPRMSDIIRTLNENEKDVVNFLIEKGGNSTQTLIRQRLGIPKTSLFRCVQSLQNKNIVNTESIGKMKKVALTEFFLSGNNNKPE
jgi:uncharacterized membrane protein